MNTAQAIEAMMNGKKVRKTSWQQHEYICIENDMIVNERGSAYLLNSTTGDWEIYENSRVKIGEDLNHFIDFYNSSMNAAKQGCKGIVCSLCPMEINLITSDGCSYSKCLIQLASENLVQANKIFELDRDIK